VADIALEFYSPEYCLSETRESGADQRYLKRRRLPDPMKSGYVDHYTGLPVLISASRDGGPVHYKGYSGVIKNFNPHLEVADVQLDIGQRTVPVKLACLRF
jgi:hypothetical protein